MSERDTQFLGFAKLLLDEIMSNNEVWYDTSDEHFREDWQRLIAQRAYDFLVSSHYHTAMLATWEESKERVALVPDMTAWPEQEA